MQFLNYIHTTGEAATKGPERTGVGSPSSSCWVGGICNGIVLVFISYPSRTVRTVARIIGRIYDQFTVTVEYLPYTVRVPCVVVPLDGGTINIPLSFLVFV